MFKIFRKIIKNNFKKNNNKQHLNNQAEIRKNTLPLNSMKIHYIDENGKKLAKDEILFGPKNTRNNYIIPSFKNYVIYNITGNLKYFIDNNDVFIEYQKLYGKPINIFFINFENYLLVKSPEIKIGKINSLYQITPPKINGYTNISHSGNLNGSFSNNVQSIIFYYKKRDWLKLSHENFYIKTNQITTVFDKAETSKTIGTIPQNSIWKIFAQLQKHDSIWLNIGSDQWIMDKNFKKVYYPFGKRLNNTKNWQIKKVHSTALLKRTRIQVFNYPGGEIIDYNIKNKKVTITSSILDDQKILWYEINNLYYIKSSDIKRA
ncbi:MucBP domain-containing protein [Apilactobacillus quenuiae]|uniref:MucBP domain-containing protein n=1 Tax=Apilactobacillus quenuiae TaxID=2008377 RepID=UPI000D012433|nr:MucBP domain-containing protein [Apilactobacillus quenuiae]